MANCEPRYHTPFRHQPATSVEPGSYHANNGTVSSTKTDQPSATLQKPPPDNGTLSIEPQAEETVANNQTPAQTLPPHLTRPEILPSNGPEKLTTLPSQDHPPAPTLGEHKNKNEDHQTSFEIKRL